MRNWKREIRFMALFLSALLLIQAPVVSAAELSSFSQPDGLPAGTQRAATDGDSTEISKDFVVDKNGIVTEYKGSLGEVTIPAQVNGIPVTGIKEQLFEDEFSLKKVTILADIKEIGKFTFYGCSNLKEVVFPEGLETIELTAFGGCSQLEEIVFPEGLKTIGQSAFTGCSSLKSIQIPLSVTEVRMCAFESCTALESLTFQEGETTEKRKIGVLAFRGCTSLTEVMLPAGMEIEGGAFGGCTSLTEYKVQEGSAYEIFDKCLYEKGRAKLVAYPAGKGAEVTFPEEITAIGGRAFDGCANLENVEIPDTVTEIGFYAFDGCSGLKKVTLPKNLGSIKDGVFQSTGITSIEIPETVTDIASSAFAWCKGLKTVTIPGKVERVDQLAFSGCSNLRSVYIQEGVKSIKSRAFLDCYSLKTLAIPKSVTEIETDALPEYENLTIYGEAGSYAETYANENNIKFSAGQPPQPEDDIYDISDKAFTVTLEKEVYDYDGGEKSPVVTVKKGEEELRRGTDFTVDYENNINPGTAKAIVTGRGEYTGTVEKTFTIKGIDISGQGFAVTLSESEYTYDGKAKEPAVTVTKGTEKLTGADFTVKYENNVNPGTAKAIVTGAGVYTGTVTKEFTIEASKDISSAGFTVTLSQTSYTYDGKAKEPAVTVAKGTEKLRGTDFTVKYENNINPGTAKAIVTGAGGYTGTVTKEFTIDPAPKDSGTDIQGKKSIGLTCKKVFTKKYGDKAFSLQAKAVKGAKITYKTSDKKVAVVDKKGKVTIKGTGIATITVKATASGYNAKTLKVTVKVSPSKASAPALKALRGRKLKVSWKRDGRATGYQVQYCTSRAFKKGVKTITISKNKTVTKTIPKLARGKRYYVRVRAYKSVKVNKKTQKLYGAWSSGKRSGKIRK
ncbi:leucine-rich repeat protein [Lachnospiraceae bacterium JLR.KK009]